MFLTGVVALGLGLPRGDPLGDDLPLGDFDLDPWELLEFDLDLGVGDLPLG